MRIMRLIVPLALMLTTGLAAQNRPAPAAITPRLDCAAGARHRGDLQPRTPSIASNGHATNRVLIYLDDGVMTRGRRAVGAD
jgi:hypothetical protein